MDDIKHWYMSKTIWGALISLAASLLHIAGIDLSVTEQGAIADSLVTIAGAVGGLLALYGRRGERRDCACSQVNSAA